MGDGGPAYGRIWCGNARPDIFVNLAAIEKDMLDDLWRAATKAVKRENQLLEVATAAMQGLLCSKVVADSCGELIVETDIVHLSWKLAAAMLAEADRRRVGKDT